MVKSAAQKPAPKFTVVEHKKLHPYSIAKVKVARNLSEETTAYTAQVLRDGKPVGSVKNNGRGGGDHFSFDTVEEREIFHALGPDLLMELDCQLLVTEWEEQKIVQQFRKKGMQTLRCRTPEGVFYAMIKEATQVEFEVVYAQKAFKECEVLPG